MTQYKVLAVTGYGGTGSSAVSDIMREFGGCFCPGSDEFWFLQDMGGISDLEYFLLEGNHRSKVSYAISSFWTYSFSNRKFYENYFGRQYLELTRAYLDSLIDSRFHKAISSFEVSNPLLRYFLFRAVPFLHSAICRITGKFHPEFSPYFPIIEKTYSAPNKERFYRATKKYTGGLIAKMICNDDPDCLIVLDQLVPAINAERYLNYVDDLGVIIVDRDPRDLFLLNELIWKGASYICDTSNIYEFISWYESMRQHRNTERESKNILHINFEDLVYKYDKTIKKMCHFLGVDEREHRSKEKYFIPKKSIINTRLWVGCQKYRPEISLIEHYLKKYCYDYEGLL